MQANEVVDDTYSELRDRAHSMMQRFVGAITLQPTAVLNEAFLKVWNSPNGMVKLMTRAGAMACISRAMLDVLVDDLRRRQSQKRGGDWQRLPFCEEMVNDSADSQKVDLNLALEELRGTHPRQAEIIEMWTFGGFKTEEIAAALRVSISTVESDLRKARGNLLAILSDA